MQLLHQPAPSDRLGEFLNTNLDGPWDSFRAAVAFVKRSGTKHIAIALASFAETRNVEIIAGIDHGGTSQEGLQDLLDAVGKTGHVIVFHNMQRFTFHPKIYLFKSEEAAELVVGSGNLTEGGLFTNYEASIRLQLDLADAAQRALLESVEEILDTWADPTKGTAISLDSDLLGRLVAIGLVPVEALSARDTGPEGAESEDTGRSVDSPFSSHPEPRAPSVPRVSGNEAETTIERSRTPAPGALRAAASTGPIGFVVTLQRTDVGVGQMTPGASRRSPEIFIPLVARNANPEFWGWPDSFVPDTSWKGPIDRDGRGKMDRTGITVRLGGATFPIVMWYNPDKRDMRIRSEALRSAGTIGDILRIEKVDSAQGYDYYIEIIPQGTTQFEVFRALCSQPVRNSKKTFGYY